MGFALTLVERHEEAVRYAEHALRLDPLPVGWYFRALGTAYAWVNRYLDSQLGRDHYRHNWIGRYRDPSGF